MSRVCSVCGTENDPELRVCVNCAAALGNFCPGCSFENPPGFKFCGNCGANLQAERAPAAARPAEVSDPRPVRPVVRERREVTVLFADIHGFTNLSEAHDPEEVFGLVQRCLNAFAEIIHTYEGSVDKFTGDGLMALFGAPVAVENHAERACRAALDMQQAMAGINREVSALLGREVRLRVGLNSGAVIAGGIGSDQRMDYTVIGDTVNVAARLESLADPGTVLISHAVYEQTKPFFEFAALGSVTVKGRREPVQTYHLLHLKQRPGPTRGIPGLRAPLIGRERELAMLSGVAEAINAGQGQIVLLMGEAGLGKSRLTAEFRQTLGERVSVVEGACLSYRQTISYWPFIAIFRQLLGLAEGDGKDADELWAQLLVRLDELDVETDEVAPFLAFLLGIEIDPYRLRSRIRMLAPAQLRQQLFLAVRRTLVAFAHKAPLLLVLEDLHWADSSSLDLLLFIAESVAREPLSLLCITRLFQGEAVERVALKLQRSHAAQTTAIELTPLDNQARAQLLAELLSIPQLPQAILDMLPQQSEGNPFFLEELVRSLIDRNVIYREGDHWLLTPGMEGQGMAVPSSLNALLMTRVDRLPEDARIMLQCAAVIGRSFTLPLLQRVVQGESPELLFYAALQRIEEAALVRRWQSPTGEGVEHAFRHVLVRDIVYNSMLREQRAGLHRRVAETIEILHGDRIESHIELLAQHFLEGQAFDRAFPYLMRSGRRAAERFENQQALHFFNTARGLTDRIIVSWEDRLELHEAIADLLVLTGGTEEALRLYQETLAEHSRTGVRHLISAELHRKIGRAYEKQSDYEEAARWLGLALAELELEGGSEALERARIYNDLGWIAYRKGDFDRGQHWALKSLELVEGTEHVQELASAYNRLMVIYSTRGEWAKALSVGRRSLTLRQRMGFDYGLSGVYNNLAILSTIQGQWTEAHGYLQQALTLSTRMGYQEGIVMALLNLGMLARLQGNLDESEALLTRAEPVTFELKNPLHICTWHFASGYLANVRRVYETAHDHATKGLAISQQIGAKETEAEATALAADALLGLQRVEEAVTLAHRAIVLAGDIDSRALLGTARRVLGKCCHLMGKLEEATQQLQKSEQLFLEYDDPYEIATTRLALSQVFATQGDSRAASQLLEAALETFERLGADHDVLTVRAQHPQTLVRRNGHDPARDREAHTPHAKAVE